MPDEEGDTSTAPPHGVGSDPSTWPTGRLLSAAARRVELAWNGYLSRWHLTHASLPVLAHLAAGPRSQRDLAGVLGVTEQTTSRIVVGLERTGYVSRENDPSDGRRRVLSLTEAGLRALHALDDAPAVEALVDHGLEPEQESELRTLLLRFL